MAAMTCVGDPVAGDDPALRAPIAGSDGPAVTSASGAKSTVKPMPASSPPLAAYTCRVRSGFPAAPALMKVGKLVAPVLTRATRPPSWSTPISTGHGVRPGRGPLERPVDAGDLAALVTLPLNGRTPPRCSRSTSALGAPVPAYDATITWPAR